MISTKKVIRRTEYGDFLVCKNDPKYFLPTFHRLELAVKHKATYIVNYGSGGSSKSYSNAQHIVKKAIGGRRKVLVIRKTGASLADSIIEEFRENALPFWGLVEGRDYTYNATRHLIYFPITKTKIIFKGLDNPEKLKSISGVTDLWFEEATEITEKEFDIVNDRIRGNPTIYLTFNPISEQHWLKKRFMDRYGYVQDPSGKSPGHYRQVNGGQVSILFSTFRENPFIGEKYVQSMREYRKWNPDHYRVYGLGLWGIIRPDNPYFIWRPSNHIHEKLEYNRKLTSIYLSWDFNINNTVLISQREPGVWVKYLELWHGGGDLRAMCQRVIATYGRANFFYFTGDGSGNNGSALTDNNAAAWELIKDFFIQAGVHPDFLHFGAVPRSNTGTGVSRTVANMLINYYGKNLQMSKEGCSLLIDDIQRMEAMPNGSLNKAECNKHNYGHAGDAFRYDLQNFDGPIVKQMWGEDIEKMLSSGHRHNYTSAAA